MTTTLISLLPAGGRSTSRKAPVAPRSAEAIVSHRPTRRRETTRAKIYRTVPPLWHGAWHKSIAGHTARHGLIIARQRNTVIRPRDEQAVALQSGDQRLQPGQLALGEVGLDCATQGGKAKGLAGIERA